MLLTYIRICTAALVTRPPSFDFTVEDVTDLSLSDNSASAFQMMEEFSLTPSALSISENSGSHHSTSSSSSSPSSPSLPSIGISNDDGGSFLRVDQPMSKKPPSDDDSLLEFQSQERRKKIMDSSSHSVSDWVSATLSRAGKFNCLIA
jgi:hypothetical protein